MFILFIFNFLLFSQNLSFINTTMLGKGGAFTADCDDENSVIVNPAGLPMLDEALFYSSIQINNSSGLTDFTNIYFGNNLDGKVNGATETFDGLSGETTRNAGSIFMTYITKKNFAYTLISTMLYDLKYNDFTDADEVIVDTFSTFDTTLQVSYGKSFLEKDKFRVGASAKTVYRVGKFTQLDATDLATAGIFPITNNDSENFINEGVAFSFDLGTQYSWFLEDMTFSYGLSALDVGTPFGINPKLFNGAGRPPTLPARVQTGVGLNIPRVFKSRYAFRTNLDIVKAIMYSEASVLDMLRMGVEFAFPKFLVLRAGLYQTYWTLGFSLNYWLGHIDFATYTENVDIYEGGTRPCSRRYVFQFSLNM